MKIQNAKPIRSRASVLIVVLSICAVAAIALASYLTLIQAQMASVSRSQSWNNSIPVAEAGIEEGLAFVNDGAPAILTSAWAWTNKSGTNGWSSFSSGQSSITRYVSGSNYYTATVDISSGTPVVTSVGVISYTSLPWQFSSLPQPLMGAVGMQTTITNTVKIGRKIQATTVLNALFTAGIITRSNITLHGNGATVDSFDSSNPLYSTLGQYNAALRKAGGDVGTDSAVVGDLSLGNGNIYGHLYTGPGSAQNVVQLGPNGAVGDIPWNTSSSGIEPGYWNNDFNMNLADVTPPTGATNTLPAPNASGNVVLNGGTYIISPSDPNIGKPLVVNSNTTLWVQGSYSTPAITISTNGANLALYVGRTSGTGDSLSLGGGGACNYPGYASQLSFYGLPSMTSLTLAGNSTFIGVVYAPDADCSFNGGGNGNGLSGSLVCNSFTINGHYNVHYDENLKLNGPSRGWIPKGWSELKYP